MGLVLMVVGQQERQTMTNKKGKQIFCDRERGETCLEEPLRGAHGLAPVRRMADW